MKNINTNHNVYILGAGFSVDAGMPLVKDFIIKMREAAEWLERQDRKIELQSIERVLDFRRESSSAAYRIKLNIDNIENLFSLASAVGSTTLTDSMINAITATLDYCEKSNYSALWHENSRYICLPLII